MAHVSFSISYDQKATAFHFFTRTRFPFDSSLEEEEAASAAAAAEEEEEESSFISPSRLSGAAAIIGIG